MLLSQPILVPCPRALSYGSAFGHVCSLTCILLKSCNGLNARVFQIANVGFFDVDGKTASRAASVGTMFIHGSRTGGGGTHYLGRGEGGHLNLAITVTTVDQLQQPTKEQCTSSCGQTLDEPRAVVAVSGTSTVCDHTCADLGDKVGGRFGSLSCGAGNPEVYGGHCRRCFVDVDQARLAESALLREAERREEDGLGGGQHVIMCDTMRPPDSASCSSRCGSKSDTVSATTWATIETTCSQTEISA